jgi:hypothetical protein
MADGADAQYLDIKRATEVDLLAINPENAALKLALDRLRILEHRCEVLRRKLDQVQVALVAEKGRNNK